MKTTQDAEIPDGRFTFDGNQEDRVTLLRQWIPLVAGRRYRLEWLASSDTLRQPIGVTWQIRAGGLRLSSGEILLGEMRAKGTLILRAVKLAPL